MNAEAQSTMSQHPPQHPPHSSPFSFAPIGLKGRGVWVVPFLGPHGGTLLAKVDHAHRQCGPLIEILPGADHLAASDAAWEELERDDPYYLRAI